MELSQGVVIGPTVLATPPFTTLTCNSWGLLSLGWTDRPTSGMGTVVGAPARLQVGEVLHSHSTTRWAKIEIHFEQPV